ncbi:MAG: hypothetical protein P8Z72_12880 [Gammaproteobacteria bacterium]
MSTLSSFYKLVATGVALLLPLVVYADSLVPEPPEAAKNYNDKTQCVEPVPEMRRNHMKYLLRHRDLTMHEGIRTKKFSLKECINCHNAPSPKDGKVASIEDKNHDHFCSTCHSYAAVKIDCFECHSDKPANTQYRHPLSSMRLPETDFSALKKANDKMLAKAAEKKESQQ